MARDWTAGVIRFIAAIDDTNGIADDIGIPWRGKLPADTAYYRNKVRWHDYLIGYGTYIHHTKPLEATRMYVATTVDEKLRPGFTAVTDARAFLEAAKGDVWVGGGADLFASVFDLADELYLTRVGGDFHCTKFFPVFDKTFQLKTSSRTAVENGISYQFQVWEKRR